MNETFKSGFISIVGRPNVGKSTLLNNIMDEKLVITSAKPQTTRNAIRCIYTDEHVQMVFIDTPGMHRPKNRLGDYMQKAAENTVSDVDAVLYLVEPEIKIGPGDQYILEKLKASGTPVILVINKIDLLPKEDVLITIAAYQKYDFLNAIIPISAVQGDGVKELLNIITGLLNPGPMFFPADMIIDQSERWIVQELIREKLLNLLNDEVPHGIAVEVTAMKPRKGKEIIDIEATIFCERKTHKGILIGKNGSMLTKIGTLARKDIEFFLKSKVNLQLWVKVRSDWRDKNFDLKELGYFE
ncbi:GTPase Era [Acetobacterium woodii]|uniref:GTPase Era n=1 Tax=Acetobacterium woodii (strain ATCC 29683 / DSM 1030 / JCM 2381 / KCTC 1655 / WB1) TaxID=931626 RepID=H6LJV3_ACEWD|nr:GTPase Era [Acetobacterium woodii]AFA48707.1 putative GTP-binding protein [Acetobacterium woodii DSM 1030]